MKPYTLLISHESDTTALELATAIHATEPGLYRLFFFQAGVSQLNTNCYPTSGPALAQRWADFLRDSGIDALACVTSALARGVLDTAQANKLGRHPTLCEGASLGGLGQLADAYEHSRVVHVK
ncbi:MAG: DsrE/DsrF/TusD sulfur relay family protein [Litorivicinus sp.]